MGWLFDNFGNWIDSKFADRISMLTNGVINLTFNITDDFWNTVAVSSILNIFTIANIIVFVITLLVLFFDIVEENGKIDVTVIFANLFKAVIFTAFNRYIGLTGLYIARIFTTNLQIDSSSQNILETANRAFRLVTDDTMNTAINAIILLIAYISFFCTCLTLNGSILIIICSSFLYIPSVVRGDTTKMGDWMRVLVSVLITFVFKYVLFYLGIYFLCLNDITSMLCSFATMMVVAKLLQNYGLASSSRGVLNSSVSIASQSISLARGFFK